MPRIVLCLLISCLVACQITLAETRQLDEFTWEGVERIVAIGDLHGDYERYLETLRMAGLVNKRGRWTGGKTHLVQTGDIPDRGPDTREIMEHIDKLSRQARKDGGMVHPLIGNHEAMNLYGDLRYVTREEFEAFKGRNSIQLRDRYYELVLQDMQTRFPDQFANLPENHKQSWEQEYPLGWVEHRQAWDPSWNPQGEYAVRTLGQKISVKINGIVFVHGGISDIYADWSLQELTQGATDSLGSFDPSRKTLVTDECGPLWYRGLSGDEPQAPDEVVTSILDRMAAQAIVVGHTPTPGIIWPRYNGRVIQIDTGIAAHYGGYPAFLEITPQGKFAGYPDTRLALPSHDDARPAYLDEVLKIRSDNRRLAAFREQLMAPDPAPDRAEVDQDSEEGTSEIIVDPDPCLRVNAEASAPAG